MTNKYDWNNILNLCVTEIGDSGSWHALSRTLNIPRITLKDGLRREFGIESTEDIAKQSEQPDDSLYGLFTQAARAIKAPEIEWPELVASDVTALVMLGDWHWGQKSEAHEMGEFGIYNPGIARQRMSQYFSELFDELIGAIDKYGRIDVRIVLLGDMLEGSLIRETQSNVISSGVVTQMLEFFAELATNIGELAANLDATQITIMGVPGNHTRLTRSRADVDPRETMDFAGYMYMQALLREFKNVQFDISESWHAYTKISRYGFYISHGDNVRAYQGLPAYGLIRMGHGIQSCMLIEDKAFARGDPDMPASAIRFVDYVLLGHFHSENFIEDIDVEVIVNGSPTGTSQFAAKDLTRASRPSQTILYVNDSGVFATRKIFLR